MERSANNHPFPVVKFIVAVLCLLACVGCTNIKVTPYVADIHPYRKTFYARFDEAVSAVKAALHESHWTVMDEVDPTIYERTKATSENQEVLIFTKTKSSFFLFGNRYKRINVYVVTTPPNQTEIEVRYQKITSLPFKKFYAYKNDRLTGKILRSIEKHLQ